MPVYLLTGPVVPNLWVTMYRINNSLGTIIACVCEYYERKRQLKNSKIVDTYRVTYTQKGVDPRSNGWKFERLGLFSALTSVAREITWPAMKWATNKHCDKSEKERWRDTPWPWTQCLRHRTASNCSLWRTGDTKNLKSGGIGRQSVELIPAAYRFYHLNGTEFRNATLTTDRLHGCYEYDYDITFISIHFLIFLTISSIYI